MPVLRSIRERFARERPLDGLRVAACLHVTAETANLVRALIAGGAEVALCAANPLVHAGRRRGGARRATARRSTPATARTSTPTPPTSSALVDTRPQVTIDDGADLISPLHERAPRRLAAARRHRGDDDRRVRLRALEAEGRLGCPVLAVNEARTERLFNNRYGTGQSTLDGILRATNLLLAGRTSSCSATAARGQGVALRARGAGRPRDRLRGRPAARARGARWTASR